MAANISEMNTIRIGAVCPQMFKWVGQVGDQAPFAESVAFWKNAHTIDMPCWAGLKSLDAVIEELFVVKKFL